jgi:hypothetical protein
MRRFVKVRVFPLLLLFHKSGDVGSELMRIIDAMTFKQPSGTSYVIGGGARGAQGKVMRHCGNCSGNGGPRRSTFEGIIAKNGGIVVGINTNFGDTAELKDSCLVGAKYGDRYTGVQSGSEPKKIGACPSSECPQSNVVTSC